MTACFLIGSNNRSQLGALLDGTLRVQFSSNIRPTNEVDLHPDSTERLLQVPARRLARADDHVVDLEQLLFAVMFDVQAVLINALIADTGQHLDPPLIQAQAVHPARGFSKALARFTGLALQQPDLTCKRIR